MTRILRSIKMYYHCIVHQLHQSWLLIQLYIYLVIGWKWSTFIFIFNESYFEKSEVGSIFERITFQWLINAYPTLELASLVV